MLRHAYYNEHDAVAAQWLRNLIAAGHIADGDVDERSIEDVAAADLVGYRQCHFFAGVGIWSLALRSAGWPDDRPIWTGSCPCQPFSAAGKSGGFADERHLWPAFFWLIEQRRPERVVGEQVASPDGLKWLDLVSTDLEGARYTVGTVDTCAAGFGAPHIRQRLYWVADAGAARGLVDDERARLEGLGDGPAASSGRDGAFRSTAAASESVRLVDASGGRRLEGRTRTEPSVSDAASEPCGVANDDGQPGRLHLRSRGPRETDAEAGGRVEAGGVGHADGGLSGRDGRGVRPEDGRSSSEGSLGREHVLADARASGSHGGVADALGGLVPQAGRREVGRARQSGGREGADVPGPTNGFWRDADWLGCRDGWWRPVEPGTFPLAHGIAGRVGRLRAFGNGLVAPQATGFIEVMMECV